MDNWNNISGVDAWSAKLEEILNDGKAAANANDSGKITEVIDRLKEFRANAIGSKYDELKHIAMITSKRLVAASIADTLGILEAAAAELKEPVNQLRGVTAEANRSADWISLKTPTDVVNRLGDTVDAVKSLYATTKDFKGVGEIKTYIDSVLAALEKLQDKVRDADSE